MRIFNWVQAKLSGSKQDKERHNSGSAFSHNSLKPNAGKEAFDDWPDQTLLAIGTLGNNRMEEDSISKHEASQNLTDFTSEEVIRIKEELTKLLTTTRKPKIVETGEAAERMKEERGVNCPSSLDADHMENLDDDDDDAKFQKIVLTRVKDLLRDNKNGSRKTSLKFLLKMFVCCSGFIPTPSLRDPLPKSRMEKILRAMLRNKIYPQSSGQPATKKYLDKQPSVRKYLEKKPTERLQLERSKEEKSEEAGKWVKTDSEYIVLEM